VEIEWHGESEVREKDGADQPFNSKEVDPVILTSIYQSARRKLREFPKAPQCPSR
jgi:hypothetical protein